MDSRRQTGGMSGMVAVLVLASVVASPGCGDGAAIPSSPACAAPGGLSGAPSTIGDVVAFANGLLAAGHQPVTIPCVVESLQRPLGVLAVNSLFSLQMARGARSPRIFLFSGDVAMSIVPGGPTIELAAYTLPTRSVKAEIGFPLTGPLAVAQTYDRVRTGNGTPCGGCHRDEVEVPGITVARAFESGVLRPRLQDEVSLTYLETEMRACDPRVEPDRCEMLTAVFGHGEVRRQEFSPNAPTIFEN